MRLPRANIVPVPIAQDLSIPGARHSYMLPIMRVANSLVPTLVAPAVCRSKS